MILAEDLVARIKHLAEDQSVLGRVRLAALNALLEELLAAMARLRTEIREKENR